MDLFRDGALSRFSDIGCSEPEFCPVWSPDSCEIAFSRGDDRAMRLLRQLISGGTATCVLDTEGPRFPTDWSSDGSLIAYNSQAPDYRHQHTWIVSANRTQQVRCTRTRLYIRMTVCGPTRLQLLGRYHVNCKLTLLSEDLPCGQTRLKQLPRASSV